MKIKYLSLFLLYLISLSSFSDEGYIFKNPNSSPKELYKNVQQYIIEKEIPIDDYYLEIMEYDYIKKLWHFYYSRKDRSKGDDLIIRVNDTNPDEIKLIDLDKNTMSYNKSLKPGTPSVGGAP